MEKRVVAMDAIEDGTTKALGPFCFLCCFLYIKPKKKGLVEEKGQKGHSMMKKIWN